jgi:hypothetical protein
MAVIDHVGSFLRNGYPNVVTCLNHLAEDNVDPDFESSHGVDFTIDYATDYASDFESSHGVDLTIDYATDYASDFESSHNVDSTTDYASDFESSHGVDSTNYASDFDSDCSTVCATNYASDYASDSATDDVNNNNNNDSDSNSDSGYVTIPAVREQIQLTKARRARAEHLREQLGISTIAKDSWDKMDDRQKEGSAIWLAHDPSNLKLIIHWTNGIVDPILFPIQTGAVETLIQQGEYEQASVWLDHLEQDYWLSDNEEVKTLLEKLSYLRPHLNAEWDRSGEVDDLAAFPFSPYSSSGVDDYGEEFPRALPPAIMQAYRNSSGLDWSPKVFHMELPPFPVLEATPATGFFDWNAFLNMPVPATEPSQKAVTPEAVKKPVTTEAVEKPDTKHLDLTSDFLPILTPWDDPNPGLEIEWVKYHNLSYTHDFIPVLRPWEDNTTVDAEWEEYFGLNVWSYRWNHDYTQLTTDFEPLELPWELHNPAIVEALRSSGTRYEFLTDDFIPLLVPWEYNPVLWKECLAQYRDIFSDSLGHCYYLQYATQDFPPLLIPWEDSESVWEEWKIFHCLDEDAIPWEEQDRCDCSLKKRRRRHRFLKDGLDQLDEEYKTRSRESGLCGGSRCEEDWYPDFDGILDTDPTGKIHKWLASEEGEDARWEDRIL